MKTAQTMVLHEFGAYRASIDAVLILLVLLAIPLCGTIVLHLVQGHIQDVQTVPVCLHLKSVAAADFQGTVALQINQSLRGRQTSLS